MTPFERALEERGALVAAWDFEDNESLRLVLYAVSEQGATQLADTDVARAVHEEMVDRLAARNVRVGATFRGSDLVWVADDQGFAVWSRTARTCAGTALDPAVERVHIWLDGDDVGHRGVRFDLRGGTNRMIAEEQTSASNQLTYSDDDLSMETLWAHYLGLHVALWHGVPLVNDISPVLAPDQFVVERGLRALAPIVEHGTDEVVQSLGAVGRSSDLTVRIGADAQNPDGHVVEVRVKLAGAPSAFSQIVKRGEPATIGPFLRRVTTPATIVSAMNKLINANKPR